MYITFQTRYKSRQESVTLSPELLGHKRKYQGTWQCHVPSTSTTQRYRSPCVSVVGTPAPQGSSGTCARAFRTIEHISPPNRGLDSDILALDQRTQVCVMVARGTSFVTSSKAMLFFRVKATPTLRCPFYPYSKKSLRFNVCMYCKAGMAMCKHSVFNKIALLRRWQKTKHTCRIDVTGSGDSESELLLIIMMVIYQ